MKTRNSITAAAALVVLTAGIILGSTSPRPAVASTPPPGTFLAITPDELGMNALTLPASGSTARTAIIRTQGARQITLSWICTKDHIAGIRTLDEGDQVAISGASLEATTVPAGDHALMHISSETAPTGFIENVSAINGSIDIRLPMPAFQIYFANTTAVAGTCTGRVFIAY